MQRPARRRTRGRWRTGRHPVTPGNREPDDFAAKPLSEVSDAYFGPPSSDRPTVKPAASGADHPWSAGAAAAITAAASVATLVAVSLVDRVFVSL
jgi:hypothetical protein